MRAPIALGLIAGVCLGSSHGAATPNAIDYRYFRALSIDFVGRPPTRAEIAEFERPDFSLDKWLDEHLAGATYAERIRRIYMDLLRLELSPTVKFEQPGLELGAGTIHGPDDKPVIVYFRMGQRRATQELDGQFCFSEAESGMKFPSAGKPIGTPKPVSQKLLDERTTVVKPWWLYADYRSPDPQDRLAPDWPTRHPGYELFASLFVNPDGSPTTTIRVCKEEAQRADLGHIYVTGHVANKKEPLLPGRLTRLPSDTPYARANPGKLVSCASQAGYGSTLECGCGVGLERCLPTWPNGFMLPAEAPLGREEAFFATPRPAAAWLQSWWTDEASQFIDGIFEDDRDVRELLTSRSSRINGPLAQFYRFFAGMTCCGPGNELGYASPEPLFDPAAVPKDLVPEDAARWVDIPDRGPHAAGILTMPIFLVKYGSRRARAHVAYNAFMCSDFVAEKVKLTPSKQPDLMQRPGCSSCHVKLEPMAAYFTRVAESDWTYLPASTFPMSLDRCKGAAVSSQPCKTYYDPDFTTKDHTFLRGGHAAPERAEEGPAGLASEITSSPSFAPCVVKNVAQSLLGRPLDDTDEAWRASLVKQFVADGYRMRPLVRAIVESSAYRVASQVKQ